jgi:hypothetical protein
MPYIPKQLKVARERVETKLERELIERLELYCRFLESDRDYVIGKALEIAFEKDKGFAEWLKTQPALVPESAPDVGPQRHPSRRQLPKSFELTPPRSTGVER